MNIAWFWSMPQLGVHTFTRVHTRTHVHTHTPRQKQVDTGRKAGPWVYSVIQLWDKINDNPSASVGFLCGIKAVVVNAEVRRTKGGPQI